MNLLTRNQSLAHRDVSLVSNPSFIWRQFQADVCARRFHRRFRNESASAVFPAPLSLSSFCHPLFAHCALMSWASMFRIYTRYNVYMRFISPRQGLSGWHLDTLAMSAMDLCVNILKMRGTENKRQWKLCIFTTLECYFNMVKCGVTTTA